MTELIPITISELKDGMKFSNLTALVVERKIAVTKNGKPYVDLILRDQTGTVKAKVWDYNCSTDEHLETAEVLTTSGGVSTYNGELQVTVSSSSPSTRPATEFAKNSRFSTDEMWKEIMHLAGALQEPLTKAVALDLLTKHEKEFKKAPAAKAVHNAWYGGLLEHTLSMCELAGSICSHYNTKYGSGKFSQDKVMFGVLLHDLCKIFEYDFSTPSFGYTPEGILANHLVMGPAIILESCNKWWEEGYLQEMSYTTFPTYEEFRRERAHLMHLVAAHHGKQEWGSPVTPSSIEAILVHQLDMIDSKFMHALELVEGKVGQIPGFSEYSRTEKTSYLKYT